MGRKSVPFVDESSLLRLRLRDARDDHAELSLMDEEDGGAFGVTTSSEPGAPAGIALEDLYRRNRNRARIVGLLHAAVESSSAMPAGAPGSVGSTCGPASSMSDIRTRCVAWLGTDKVLQRHGGAVAETGSSTVVGAEAATALRPRPDVVTRNPPAPRSAIDQRIGSAAMALVLETAQHEGLFDACGRHVRPERRHQLERWIRNKACPGQLAGAPATGSRAAAACRRRPVNGTTRAWLKRRATGRFEEHVGRDPKRHPT